VNGIGKYVPMRSIEMSGAEEARLNSSRYISSMYLDVRDAAVALVSIKRARSVVSRSFELHELDFVTRGLIFACFNPVQSVRGG